MVFLNSKSSFFFKINLVFSVWCINIYFFPYEGEIFF